MVVNYTDVKSVLKTIIKSKNNVKIVTPEFKLNCGIDECVG